MIAVDPLILLAFIPASLALNPTPGAGMMSCLGQGLRAGPRAARFWYNFWSTARCLRWAASSSTARWASSRAGWGGKSPARLGLHARLAMVSAGVFAALALRLAVMERT